MKTTVAREYVRRFPLKSERKDPLDPEGKAAARPDPRRIPAQALRNPFNWVLGAIFVVGLPLIAGRFHLRPGLGDPQLLRLPLGAVPGLGPVHHGAAVGLRLHARHHGGTFRP